MSAEGSIAAPPSAAPPSAAPPSNTSSSIDPEAAGGGCAWSASSMCTSAVAIASAGADAFTAAGSGAAGGVGWTATRTGFAATAPPSAGAATGAFTPLAPPLAALPAVAVAADAAPAVTGNGLAAPDAAPPPVAAAPAATSTQRVRRLSARQTGPREGVQKRVWC